MAPLCIMIRRSDGRFASAEARGECVDDDRSRAHQRERIIFENVPVPDGANFNVKIRLVIKVFIGFSFLEIWL